LEHEKTLVIEVIAMAQQALQPMREVTLPDEYIESARRYVNASKATGTRRMYESAWAGFETYCHEHTWPALPASVNAVAAYLTALADEGQKASTIQVKASAISFMHDGAKLPNPIKTQEIRALMAGIRRTIGTAQQGKAPIGLAEVKRIVAALPDDLRAKRDKALLLLGFAGAFRRSELVALEVSDIRFNDVKATITLRRSKTDQEGAGKIKTIPMLADESLCPVVALRQWLDAAGINKGIVFRGIDKWGHVHDGQMAGIEVARVVKARATAAGLDPRQFAGHSLRAGYVTECAAKDVPTWQIMEQTGHTSEKTLRKYIRDEGLGAMNATKAAFNEG
jgi:integrase